MSNWRCTHCSMSIEHQWDICWNCGGGKDGEPPTKEFERIQGEVDQSPGDEASQENHWKKIDCLRCQSPMSLMGGIELVTGKVVVYRSLFGHSAEHNSIEFDAYVCESCGKVEWFIDLD